MLMAVMTDHIPMEERKKHRMLLRRFAPCYLPLDKSRKAT
jgi:hypothetical protein